MLLNIQNLSIQVQTQTTNKTLVRKVNLAIEQEKNCCFSRGFW